MPALDGPLLHLKGFKSYVYMWKCHKYNTWIHMLCRSSTNCHHWSQKLYWSYIDRRPSKPIYSSNNLWFHFLHLQKAHVMPEMNPKTLILYLYLFENTLRIFGYLDKTYLLQVLLHLHFLLFNIFNFRLASSNVLISNQLDVLLLLTMSSMFFAPMIMMVTFLFMFH